MQIDLFYISQSSHEIFREFELFCTNLNHTFTFYLNNLKNLSSLIAISQDN